jgi:hypothetical protein
MIRKVRRIAVTIAAASALVASAAAVPATAQASTGGARPNSVWCLTAKCLVPVPAGHTSTAGGRADSICWGSAAKASCL